MERLENLIKFSPILILTKENCRFCLIAKSELLKANMEYVEIDVSGNMELFQAATVLTRQTTIPNIWMHGVHIGGSDKLIAELARHLSFDEDF